MFNAVDVISGKGSQYIVLIFRHSTQHDEASGYIGRID